MTATVLIDDIVKALDMDVDEMFSYLDLQTGKVHSFTTGELGPLEDGEESDLPAEAVAVAHRVVHGDKTVVDLPDDINEWSIMEEFSESVKDARVRGELSRAIHGKGAFRNFKDTVKRHRIERDYYDFRDAALRKIAIAWCAENDIPWK